MFLATIMGMQVLFVGSPLWMWGKPRYNSWFIAPWSSKTCSYTTSCKMLHAIMICLFYFGHNRRPTTSQRNFPCLTPLVFFYASMCFRVVYVIYPEDSWNISSSLVRNQGLDTDSFARSMIVKRAKSGGEDNGNSDVQRQHQWQCQW